MHSNSQKTILVTGGAGFIGSNLVKRLLKEGHKVVVVDDFNDYYAPKIKWENLEPVKSNPRLQILKLDIRNSYLTRIMKDYRFDAVVHLAARAGVRPSIENPELYHQVNVVGTKNVLDSIQKNNIPQLIFASSSSIYGNRTDGPFKESDNTDAQISPYGETKKAGELLCESYAKQYGIQTTCLRFFTVYGPGNRPDLACLKFMKSIQNEETIHQFGDGNTGRDYTYVDDTVAGIMTALENPFDFETINLGNSHPVLLKDMISVISKVVGKEPKIEVEPMQPGDVEFTFADISKAKQLLSWEPQTSFEDGISNMWQWYSSSSR